MLNMTEYHREHEKFYAKSPLKDAIDLQEASLMLKAIADRWSRVEPATASEGNPYRGCEDLNAKGDIAHTGLLFMETEGEPAEIRQMKRIIGGRAQDFAEAGEWLVHAMESAWDSAKSLVQNPALAGVLGERHRIISNDHHAAHLFSLASRQMRRALDILEHIDLSSAAVRRDLSGPRFYPAYLYSASELLDLAADGLAECGPLIHDNERRWRVYRERLERSSQGRSAAGGNA